MSDKTIAELFEISYNSAMRAELMSNKFMSDATREQSEFAYRTALEKQKLINDDVQSVAVACFNFVGGAFVFVDENYRVTTSTHYKFKTGDKIALNPPYGKLCTQYDIKEGFKGESFDDVKFN